MKPNGLLNLALKQVRDWSVQPCNDCRFISEEFGIVRSVAGIQDISGSRGLLRQPYRLTEGRIIHLRSGYVRVRVNLHDLTIKVHQMVVASPGTVAELVEVSPDCELSMLGIANSFMEGWQKEEQLTAYLQGRLYLCLELDEAIEQRLETIFSLLWEMVHDVPFPRAIVQSLISTLFYQIAYLQQNNRFVGKTKYTRQEEVFNRFIRLVNKYAIRERNVAFYADRLYLTPRYLSTLIRQVSDHTVMDWINEAVIQEAKILLLHSDKLVYQIADELNFPNPSFFSKFFHRMTGKTPNEYRAGK